VAGGGRYTTHREHQGHSAYDILNATGASAWPCAAGYYAEKGGAYTNPHDPGVREMLARAVRDWPDLWAAPASEEGVEDGDGNEGDGGSRGGGVGGWSGGGGGESGGSGGDGGRGGGGTGGGGKESRGAGGGGGGGGAGAGGGAVRGARAPGRILDLSCGSGEVTSALVSAGIDISRIDACDPFTGDAFLRRTGRAAETWSFEDIAQG